MVCGEPARFQVVPRCRRSFCNLVILFQVVRIDWENFFRFCVLMEFPSLVIGCAQLLLSRHFGVVKQDPPLPLAANLGWFPLFSLLNLERTFPFCPRRSMDYQTTLECSKIDERRTFPRRERYAQDVVAEMLSPPRPSSAVRAFTKEIHRTRFLHGASRSGIGEPNRGGEAVQPAGNHLLISIGRCRGDPHPFLRARGLGRRFPGSDSLFSQSAP